MKIKEQECQVIRRKIKLFISDVKLTPSGGDYHGRVKREEPTSNVFEREFQKPLLRATYIPFVGPFHAHS